MGIQHRNRLDSYVDMLENAMEGYIPNIPVAQVKLLDAVHYSIFAGGKRIRPVLLLEFCRVCGGSVGDALPFAAALEMIHTYSLIHDDLPCMDDDKTRRGRPCNHIIFGEATATLAGNALLTAAFETMLDEENTKNIDPRVAMKAAHTIAWSSGIYGMLGGQQLDIDNDGMDASLQSASVIHGMKTGALFAAAAEAGCRLAGAEQRLINRAVTYANFLGLVFQIKDDILNVEGSAEKLGKGVGTDVLNEKLTFVKVLGIAKCHELAETLTGYAAQSLEAFEDSGFLLWLTEALAKRDS